MRELLRDEWVEYLDGFSRRQEGWPVTVEAFGAEVGAQVEARELPPRGVTAGPKGGEGAITIMLGGADAGRATHTGARPAHARIEQAANGADMALQIEAADGMSTLVRLRSAVPPEAAEGIASFARP